MAQHMYKWLVWQDGGSGMLFHSEDAALEYAREWVHQTPSYLVYVARVKWAVDTMTDERVR